MPTNLQADAQMKNFIIGRLRGAGVDKNMSIWVIRRVLLMQETHLQTKSKKQKAASGASIVYKKPAIRDIICQEFGIGHEQYSRIVTLYFTKDLRNRKVYLTAGTRKKPGNATKKERRVSLIVKNTTIVQNHIREQRAQRKRITAQQLFDFSLLRKKG